MRFVLLLVAVIGAKAICAGNLDVAFIVDGSDSICGDPGYCTEWVTVLTFIRDLVNSWTIGPLATEVALATFGDHVSLIWNLDEYTDKDDLDYVIGEVVFPGGELTTQGLINAVLKKIFNVTGPDRSDAPDVEVLITDGTPYLSIANASANSAVRQNEGVTVLVVCVQPGCDESFAQKMASPPKEINKTYFMVDGCDSINDIKDALLVAIDAI